MSPVMHVDTTLVVLIQRIQIQVHDTVQPMYVVDATTTVTVKLDMEYLPYNPALLKYIYMSVY